MACLCAVCTAAWSVECLLPTCSSLAPLMWPNESFCLTLSLLEPAQDPGPGISAEEDVPVLGLFSWIVVVVP